MTAPWHLTAAEMDAAWDDLAAESAALREENERLTAANKARVEYLTTRRAGNDVDSYVNLAETKIEELRARLADIEAQNRVMWDVANDREARLAEAERVMREYRDGYLSHAKVVARMLHLFPPAASASVCPFHGPGKSDYTPTLCPVCNNDFRKCAEIRAAGQPEDAA